MHTLINELCDKIERACGVGRLLHVGSGAGNLVQALNARGFDAFGVDSEALAISEAETHSPDRFTSARSDALPYNDGAFDIVVCTNIAAEGKNADTIGIIKEMARVSREAVFIRAEYSAANGASLSHFDRAALEGWCFEAGLRKHPAYHHIIRYERIELEETVFETVLERVPQPSLKQFPLDALKAERDLHMDMTRETGRRSDAHMFRYHQAAGFVRPDDRVLDIACGLGYGASSLLCNSLPREVIGVDNSSFAIEYAKLNFSDTSRRVNFILDEAIDFLERAPVGSFDFIASFETLEHLSDPRRFLAACQRVLTPGGRLFVSVPNDWTEADGKDPNPYHYQVYTWSELVNQLEGLFLIERVAGQTASRRKENGKWVKRGREWRDMEFEEAIDLPCEWCLVLAMTNPSESHGIKSSHGYGVQSRSSANILDFENQFDNPWLVRSLISIGLRTESRFIQNRISNDIINNHKISADRAASLAISAYQLLERGVCWSDAQIFLDQIEPHVSERDWSAASPIEVRWAISLLYVAGKLCQASGKFDEAIRFFDRCSELPFFQYSALVATKTVDALFNAGIIYWVKGSKEISRTYFENSVVVAQQAVSIIWEKEANLSSDIPKFALAELSEILDLARKPLAALQFIHFDRPSGRQMLDIRWNRSFELQQARSRVSQLQSELTQFDETRSQWFEPQIEALQAECDRLDTIRREWYEPQLKALQAECDRLDATRREWYEPQLEALQAECDRLDTTRREWYEPQLEALQAECNRLDATRREWYEPRLEALQSECDRLDTTRREWYEPQLSRLEEEIRRLNDTVEQQGEELARERARRSDLEASMQAEYQRSLFYAENSDRYQREAEHRNDDCARLKNEVDRLTLVFASHDQKLALIENSNSYRMIKACIRLHDHRLLGFPIRTFKRLIRILFRMR